MTAIDEFHELARFMTWIDMYKPKVASELSQNLLIPRVAIAMHQDNCDAINSAGQQFFERKSRLDQIETLDFLPFGLHSPAAFDHPLIELIRKFDVQVEEFGSLLRSYPKHILKAPIGHQSHALPLSLQKRVGCDGRAHFYHLDPVYRERVMPGQTEHSTNTLHRCVLVLSRVIRKQLSGPEGAIGFQGDHVSEGPAPIDPEFPARCRFRHQPGTLLIRTVL